MITRNETDYTLQLEDGGEVWCDGVVVAVGAVPAVDWLAGTPLAARAGRHGPGRRDHRPGRVRGGGLCELGG